MQYIEFDVLFQSEDSLRNNPITFKLQPLQNADGRVYTFVEFVGELKTSVRDILSKITVKHGPIDKFTFGRTFAKARKDLKDFDHMDTKTWDKGTGVMSRWITDFRPRSYDGLVILCAVPRGFRPPKDSKHTDEQVEPTGMEILTPENYVLALEQQLIHYYAFTKQDRRLENASLNPGNASPEEAKAYVLFLAFKLQSSKDKEDEEKKKEMTVTKTTDKKDEMEELEDGIKKNNLK